VVLDLSLPGTGGLEVLATVRRKGSLPVIVLTARRDETEQIVALDLGADDYVVKPFSPRELAARVRSVLRRSAPAEPARVLNYGPLRIDLEARAVHVDGTPVELTAKEFNLLSRHARS
jgi:two-component system, OmpR family, phosphate regulon response regulator PhoB